MFYWQWVLCGQVRPPASSLFPFLSCPWWDPPLTFWEFLSLSPLSPWPCICPSHFSSWGPALPLCTPCPGLLGSPGFTQVLPSLGVTVLGVPLKSDELWALKGAGLPIQVQLDLLNGTGFQSTSFVQHGVILDQLCHPLHWVRPPYWNMVMFHRTEGKIVFSRRCVTCDPSMGAHLEIGSLQMGLKVLG
jgi:hypothetical protein